MTAQKAHPDRRATGRVAPPELGCALGSRRTWIKGLYDALLADEKQTETDHVNRIRARVKLWRDRGYPDVTPVTRAFLEH